MKKSTMYLISVLITILLMAVNYYIMLPPINIHATEFWVFILVSALLFTLLSRVLINVVLDESTSEDKPFKYFQCGMLAITALVIVMVLASTPLFHAKSYANLISDQVEVLDWDENMEDVDSVSNIALMDTATADVFGQRTLGSLSDIVSQYTVSDDYTQINYQGTPQKVSTLQYAGFWKWMSNKSSGIPGYVMVDPVETTAKYVALDTPIKYSPSEYFGRDLYRHIRFQYPTEMIYDYFFEVDEEGNPYYIITTVDKTIGFFGGNTINRVIILNACTGETELMNVEDVPEWVDVVYSGDYLIQRLDWYGQYQNGYFNTLLSKSGCKQTTKIGDSYDSDYGYITRDFDTWLYTGITSMASDNSDIAVVMANERTGKVEYYTIAGADEESAMEAAEGEVQQYGYDASFPSLISVNGEPTYIMVLTDDNSIVKSYAMVNMENYSKVVVADTQAKVFAAYLEKMGLNASDTLKEELAQEDTDEADVNYLDITFTIQDIQFIATNGNTVVYITATDGNHYKSDFNEFWILANKGDEVKAQYKETDKDNQIIKITNFE
jgi:hypothetical protein